MFQNRYSVKLNALYWSNIQSDYHKVIKYGLEEKGYCLIKNYPLGKLEIENVKKAFLAFCKEIAQPIGHDKKDTLVWDIKSRPLSSDQNGVITYSEHNHEADLHTDSQYSACPEDYFSLLTLEKAKCGGGMSYLLSVDDIIYELDRSQKGKEVLEIIQTTTYPFIIPNVFKKNTGTQPEFNSGYILKDGKMRFRVDTIQKALDFDYSMCTPEQIEAFNFLVELVRNTQYTERFFLEKGDLIFINNKTTLHGRGGFTDFDRHLLRVRMNKYQS